MGTTATFLKKRVSKPTIGKWSSGFSAVKKYAESNNIPLVAVWSNGDACGHCVNFEKSVSESAFTTWQASSGCVFWFGCSSDTTKDDKTNGTGYAWTRNDGKLSTYPFVRVYWKSGKVDKADSGSNWTGGTAKGGATFVKKIKDLLKNFKPGTTTTTTTTTQPTCEGGDCGTESCDCDDLKKQIENLSVANQKLQAGIADVKAKWSTLLYDVDELEKAIKSL